MADSGTIKRALAVLEEARDCGKQCQTKAVALALYVLRGRCETTMLTWFWESAGTEHDIGRSQNINAAYNGIERQAWSNRSK